jgi:hypothetical protein
MESFGNAGNAPHLMSDELYDWSLMCVEVFAKKVTYVQIERRE